MPKTKSSRSTSSGPSLSQKELVRVYGRLHANLAKQVRSTRKANAAAKGKDPKVRKQYDEAAKELYAYVRLMELCQMLSRDVMEMQQIINGVATANLLTQGGNLN